MPANHESPDPSIRICLTPLFCKSNAIFSSTFCCFSNSLLITEDVVQISRHESAIGIHTSPSFSEASLMSLGMSSISDIILLLYLVYFPRCSTNVSRRPFTSTSTTTRIVFGITTCKSPSSRSAKSGGRWSTTV